MADNPRIEDLRRRLEKEPGSRLFAQLAEELRKEGDHAEAIRVAREGLEKHPAYPSARMTLGRALFDMGDAAGARVELEAVLKGAADNILASRLLAECLEKLGDLAGAMARYKTTLMMAPGDKQVQTRLHEVEDRLKAPAAAPGAAAGPAGGSAAAPPGAAAEPPPIPLVAVSEDAFELEQSHERDLSGAPTLPGVPALISAPGPTPGGATGSDEPAPIAVVAADEPFELERPHEARPPSATAAPAVSPASLAVPMPPERPAAAPPEAADREADFEFEVPAPTLPFQARARVLLEDEVAAPPAPALAVESSGEIVSSTLAELYFKQGFTDKAVEVYRQLVHREPENERARARLAELQVLEAPTSAGAAAPPPPADSREARRQAIERAISRLETLLAAVRRG